jgi:parallel beta-helix repeat protein
MTDHVVDGHQGTFTTVSAAIEAASPGDRIYVRPGRYDESLMVDKQLEIVGDGHRASIEIRGTDDHVLTFRALAGRVANLTLSQSRGQVSHGVFIGAGQLVLEDCVISSDGGACVYVHGDCDPRLRGNLIHDSQQGGVFFYQGARGLLEDNEIIGSRQAGVEVWAGASPLLRRNVIRDGQQDGVYVHGDGAGTFEENLIAGNAHSGVHISSGGRPTIRGNRINDNARHGVNVLEGGGGVVEDNDLSHNRQGAWHFAHHARHTIVRARNKEH